MSDDILTLSLIDLPRHLGSRKDFALSWTAPDDLGTSSMAVKPGEQLDLDVALTSVDNGVLVQVDTDVTLHGECVRCLDPVSHDHHISLAEVFFEEAPVVEEGDEETEEVWLIGPRDTVDLEPIIRDGIVTRVDELPLCRPDCVGLCPDCGEKWDDLPEDHAHEVIDPRLAGLAALLQGVDLEVEERDGSADGGDQSASGDARG